MSATDLRATLAGLDLSQVDFSRLTGKTTVTVNRWCAGTYPVDPLALAYLKIFALLTAEQRKIAQTPLDSPSY